MARRNVNESVQARRTGMVLIVLLAGLASLALWREHPQRAAFWAGASILSVFLVFAAPRAWYAVWRVWMRVALAISAVITVVILGVCYYLLFMPVGLVMRAAGRDALRIAWRRKSVSYWVGKEPVESSLERYRRQF